MRAGGKEANGASVVAREWRAAAVTTVRSPSANSQSIKRGGGIAAGANAVGALP